MTITALSLLAGAIVTVGLLVIVAAFRPAPGPDLVAALEVVSGRTSSVAENVDQTRIGRIGRSVTRTFHVSVSPAMRAALRLQGTTPEAFYGRRLICALIGAILPWLLNAVAIAVGANSPNLLIPSALCVALAGAGWMLPAARLKAAAGPTNDDSFEALLVFIDLVVLERLANETSVDALTNAANMSDSPLFVQIRQVLNRAFLENVDPWNGLDRLAEDIKLPELTDVVSIARLQNEGASLVDSFRARVAELRDAYLLRLQQESTAITQRLGLWTILQAGSVMLILLGAAALTLITAG